MHTRRPLGAPKGGKYATKLGEVRGSLRKLIAAELGRLAPRKPGGAKAVMYWTGRYFFKRVVMRHRLILVGWPQDIVFGNLSAIPGGIAPLERLLGLWQHGLLHFERISAEQLAVLDEGSAAPGRLASVFPAKARSDVGKHRYRFVNNPLSLPVRHPGMGAKSPWYITDGWEKKIEKELEGDFDPIEEAEEPERVDVDEIEEFSD